MVVGVYSILEFFGAGQAPDLERIPKARKVRPRAGSVYSNFPGPGRFLVESVERRLGNPGTLGEICILKGSGPGQVPVLGRIQDTRKNWAQAESVYSKIQGPGRFLAQGVYLCAQKAEAQAIQASYLSEYTG